jgi:hypothetical protein
MKHRKEIDNLLKENKVRYDTIVNLGDQRTGKGCHNHSIRLELKDCPIRVQYVTEEVFQTEVYQSLSKAGSVRQLVKDFNALGMDVDDKDIMNWMFKTRCEHDPWFAFYHCFMITYKLTGEVGPFILNYPQHIVLSKLEDMRKEGKPMRLILLKARQWGGSTLVQLYMAWIQLFVKKGWNSVIVAQTKDTARRIKSMYRRVLDEFPAFLLNSAKLTFAPKEGSAADSIIVNENDEDIRNDVVTIASYENFEAARGAAFAMAHYSEVAYWAETESKSAASVITNIDGGISYIPLTLEVLESTANGMSGYFYEEYQKAKAGTSAYSCLFIPFFYIENDKLDFKDSRERYKFACQLYDERVKEVALNDNSESGEYLWNLWLKGASLEHIHWYVEKRKGYHGHDHMASEAPSDDRECFRYSGANVFSAECIEREELEYACIPSWRGDIRGMEDDGEKDGNRVMPKLVPNELGSFWIWKKPKSFKTRYQYVVTVDVGGRSEKADYSVITVLDRWATNIEGGRLEVVARWRGHLRFDLMAWKAVYIARYYKDALLVFESNTFDQKEAMRQDYVVEMGDHIRSILKTIEGKYKNLYYRRGTDQEDLAQGNVRKIGFQTNVKTKQDMVDNFVVLFEDGGFLDPDERFYREAEIYEQRPNGSYGNIPGPHNHDDILMTNMIGALVARDMPKPKMGCEEDKTVQFEDRGTINESTM